MRVRVRVRVRIRIRVRDRVRVSDQQHLGPAHGGGRADLVRRVHVPGRCRGWG